MKSFFVMGRKRTLTFGLIAHVRYIVDGDEGQRVFPADVVHQLLVFIFVDNGDDLVVSFHIISTDGLVDRGTAVQILNNKAAKRLFLFCDDADAPFYIMVEDEVIQNDAVKVRAENA